MMFRLRKKNSDPVQAPEYSGTLGRIRSLIIPRRLARDTEGAAAIEFALVFPVFLMVLLGIIEIGRAFWVRTSMQFAVEEASRIAMADYTLQSWTEKDPDVLTAYLAQGGGFEDKVRSDTSDSIFGWNPDSAKYNAEISEDGTTLKVWATTEFEFLVPFANVDSIPMTAMTATPLVR